MAGGIMPGRYLRAPDQSHDDRNAAFWDELCGTGLAESVGIDRRPGRLPRFDEPTSRCTLSLAVPRTYRGRDRRGARDWGRVGTLGQLLASAGAVYHGVDIAAGPGAGIQKRLRLGDSPAKAIVRRRLLDLPHEDGTFDLVETIGCLHHTGDLPSVGHRGPSCPCALGTAVVMVYNSRSLRQFS